MCPFFQQVPNYAKIFKDMCTKKRKTNVPKKVFLTTKISELLSNQIPFKYKDTSYPTISCTIGQTEINWALINLGVSINLFPFSVYQQLGLANWTFLHQDPIEGEHGGKNKCTMGISKDEWEFH